MKYANVNQTRLAYRELGRRHPHALLLIHGFPLDHRMWASQLASLGPHMRLIAPDLRGHGQSALPAGAAVSMDQHADDLASLLDHLGIRKAAVAGLSMGGYVALALWRRHPDRIGALVLLDTRAEADTPEGQAGRDAAIARVPSIGPVAYAEEMLPRLISPVSLADPRITAHAREIMAAQPVAGTVAALAGLRDRLDSRPTLPTITAPTLVLVGEHDTVTPPSAALAMAGAIPGAHMVVVPRAGHLSPLENPRAVNRALRQFLGATYGSA